MVPMTSATGARSCSRFSIGRLPRSQTSPGSGRSSRSCTGSSTRVSPRRSRSRATAASWSWSGKIAAAARCGPCSPRARCRSRPSCTSARWSPARWTPCTACPSCTRTSSRPTSWSISTPARSSSPDSGALRGCPGSIRPRAISSRPSRSPISPRSRPGVRCASSIAAPISTRWVSRCIRCWRAGCRSRPRIQWSSSMPT